MKELFVTCLITQALSMLENLLALSEFVIACSLAQTKSLCYGTGCLCLKPVLSVSGQTMVLPVSEININVVILVAG